MDYDLDNEMELFGKWLMGFWKWSIKMKYGQIKWCLENGLIWKMVNGLNLWAWQKEMNELNATTIKFQNQFNFLVINSDHPTQLEFPKLIRKKNEMISKTKFIFKDQI